MKKRVIFVERHASGAVSIERVFAQIARSLPPELFDVEIQKLPYGYGPISVLKNLLFFRKKPADIYHITGDIHYIALRLPKNRTLLTIHDLIFLRTKGRFRRSILKVLFLDLPVNKIDHITAVSRATRDEICNYWRDAKNKIRIIENPLIEGFTPGAAKPFDVSCPTILQIGTAQNKNIHNLVEAVREIDCTLRIIGSLDANIIRKLKAHKIRFENVEDVDAGQMVEEYRNADIVTFCSTYEGFGLPIIEAQAMRKPVITSDRPPMNDVAGDGAEFADPSDVLSIRSAIIRLINDANRRERLVELGTNNVKRFDSAKIAVKYADLYNHILEK